MKKKQTIDDWDGDHNKDWNPKTDRFEIIDSLWDRIKWNLFGEFRFIYWIIAISIISSLLWWGAIFAIGFHFISKFW